MSTINQINNLKSREYLGRCVIQNNMGSPLGPKQFDHSFMIYLQITESPRPSCQAGALLLAPHASKLIMSTSIPSQWQLGGNNAAILKLMAPLTNLYIGVVVSCLPLKFDKLTFISSESAHTHSQFQINIQTSILYQITHKTISFCGAVSEIFVWFRYVFSKVFTFNSPSYLLNHWSNLHDSVSNLNHFYPIYPSRQYSSKYTKEIVFK
jgi:hypothetical protein